MVRASVVLPVPLSPSIRSVATRVADRRHGLEHTAHLRVARKQLSELETLPPVRPQAPVLGLQRAPLERTADGQRDLLVGGGLLDVVEGPPAHGLDRVVDRPEGREQDHGGAVVGIVQVRQIVHVRRVAVGQEHVVAALPQRPAQPRAARADAHGQPESASRRPSSRAASRSSSTTSTEADSGRVGARDTPPGPSGRAPGPRGAEAGSDRDDMFIRFDMRDPPGLGAFGPLSGRTRFRARPRRGGEPRGSQGRSGASRARGKRSIPRRSSYSSRSCHAYVPSLYRGR